MKVTSKILILVIAITLAIGGVLIYAKTKVEPPRSIKSINQFSNNIENCFKEFSKDNTPLQEDSIFETTINKIKIYLEESKIDSKTGDANIDKLLSLYTPLFLKRAYDKFHQSVWLDSDHKYMMDIVSKLRSIKHTDDTPAIPNKTAENLTQIENIITKYKQARALSRRTGFYGVSNARETISKARMFASDKHLSSCTGLVSALNKVRPSIAQSHYNYISGMVEKLSQYRFVSETYYMNTLIPKVDAVVTEYDNNASSLYGKKQDVNYLWKKARGYYDSARQYYHP